MPQERRSFYKSESEIGTLCPVCGWDLQADKSDEICPCCGFQFNYGDSFAKDAFERSLIYHGYRYRWIKDGMNWHFNSSNPPLNWDAKTQLKKIQNIQTELHD